MLWCPSLCSTAGTFSSRSVPPLTPTRAAWTSSPRVGGWLVLRMWLQCVLVSSQLLRNSLQSARLGHALLTSAAAHWSPPTPAGYRFYGLNRGEHEGKQGIWYREWAPGAQVNTLLHSREMPLDAFHVLCALMPRATSCVACCCPLCAGGARRAEAGWMSAAEGAYRRAAGKCDTPSSLTNCSVFTNGRRWHSLASSTTGTPSRSTGPSRTTLACGSSSCPTRQTAPPPSSTGAAGLWGGSVHSCSTSRCAQQQAWLDAVLLVLILSVFALHPAGPR